MVKGKWFLGAMVGALLFSAAARADRGVVVGIQKYPNLSARANNLRGCVNDARAMKASLEKYGFTITLLIDEQATKKGILEALEREKSAMGPKERFVFFFAGHGTDTPGPSLLPSDALEDKDLNHLTRDELYNAVVAIPAYSRTVLLDSCFSGGMARSLEKLREKRPGLRARYYPAGGNASMTRSPVPVSNQDSNAAATGTPTTTGGSGGDICYYVASLGNEKALEDNFQGTQHGVFTHFLVSELDGKKELWKDVHTTVKGKVVDFLFDWQHPTLSPAPYLQTAVFEAKTPPGQTPPVGTTPPAAGGTVWETYNSDFPDPAMISMGMTPDKTDVRLGEELRFTAKVGGDGYLVILERDMQGDVYLLFPKKADAESARVKAGQVVRIPADAANVYKPDRAGTEHVKAILFTSKDRAESVLRALPRDGVPLKGMKRLREQPAADAPFFTSSITFEVAEGGAADGKISQR